MSLWLTPRLVTCANLRSTNVLLTETELRDLGLA